MVVIVQTALQIFRVQKDQHLKLASIARGTVVSMITVPSGTILSVYASSGSNSPGTVKVCMITNRLNHAAYPNYLGMIERYKGWLLSSPVSTGSCLLTVNPQQYTPYCCCFAQLGIH